MKGAVTLALGHRVLPPFKWILFTYWFSNYGVGLGHAKKGLFLLCSFSFLPTRPSCKGEVHLHLTLSSDLFP